MLGEARVEQLASGHHTDLVAKQGEEAVVHRRIVDEPSSAKPVRPG